MSKYKCISSDFLHNQDSLTIGKIYDIIEHDKIDFNGSEKILYVINNDNMQMYFSTRITDLNYIGNWFEDATAEIRDNKINQILKKKF